MKRWAMVAALVLAAGTAWAAAVDDETKMKNCASWGSIAEGVMTARHNGTPMQNLMEKMADTPEVNRITRAIIIEAYESPRFTSPEYASRSVENFRDRWYLICIKGK